MRTIDVWGVYFLANCRHAKPLPKDKFVVVACFDPNPCGFFVNSKVNDFIQQTPALLACEVMISAALHPFLQRDSWLDCRELLSLNEGELSDQRGVIASTTLPNILLAVQHCPVLRPRFKKLILGDMYVR